MASLIFGVLVLALALWALNAFTKVNPHTAAAVLKAGGGLGALAIAGLLGARSEAGAQDVEKERLASAACAAGIESGARSA